MITVRELTKIFETDSVRVTAVDRVSFTVERGEVYGLLGPNGAGKTTTMRMVLGLLQPTAGEASVDGFRVSVDPEEIKRRIGFVSTTAGLYQWLSPAEVLLFFADLYGVEVPVAEQRMEELTELLGLQEFLHRRCAVLSAGQQQRVTLARALMHNPPVMLLDEPTRGLDVIGSQVIFEYISHLRSEGKAVIVCTHRLDEAERLCDRFGLLHDGKLRHEGRLPELQERTGCATLTEMFLQMLQESQAQLIAGNRP